MWWSTRYGVIGAFAAALTLAVTAAASMAGPAAGSTAPISQTRAADPVVFGGSLVPSLIGVPVGDIVAFRWANRWVQSPVQIDQRKRVEMNRVYGKPANTTNPVNVVVYADPNTFVGAASGKLTSLDVIVFMARTVGSTTPPSFREPAGVLHNTGVRVRVNDPLTGAVGYFYLFRRSGTTLVPGMGHHNVTHRFRLLSGAYKATYKVDAGPNPENSVVSTASYTRHFGDRWLDDVITVKAGTATGADIVDRHKQLFFGPGDCRRSEDTFDGAEGAFVANVVGPLRAIRSYIGANSGPYTQRTHTFYDQREDILTDLRVHPIGSSMDFWDYSPAASGMRYSNNLNLNAVTIDGAPDTVASGAPLWEKVGGPQGTLTHVERLVTSVSGLSKTNYYYDDATNPTTTQCSGDAHSYGSSGIWIDSSIPNTDPHYGPAVTFRGRDTMYFEPPARGVAVAQKHSSQVSNPLTLSATLYRGPQA
jgi:hypothetical protein